MLHVLGVPLALFAANATRLGASLDDRSRDANVERRLAAENVSGRRAHVRAVEVQADAADERLDVVFTEARVRARGAGLGAVVTGFDTAAEHARVDESVSRMGLDICCA
jgi:hypothetical protein